MNDFLVFTEGLTPGFSQQLRGSDPATVVEYANLLGHQLPTVYRAFLEMMGDSDGGLQVFEDAKTSAGELVCFYRRSVLTGECRVPLGTIPVAVNGWTLNEACMSVSHPDDGPVFTNRDDRIEFLYSDRLGTLLYKKAFLALGMNALPISGMYLAQDIMPRLDCVREALTGLSHQLESYSDSVGLAARLENGMLFARQHSGTKCWVRIAGQSQRAITAVARIICSSCKLQFDRWRVPQQQG
jgi:hypothetical protein